ncbi:hypothetical protein Ahia01_000960700 [Argonauta hians]
MHVKILTVLLICVNIFLLTSAAAAATPLNNEPDETRSASKRNSDQQTPPADASSAADTMNPIDFSDYTTTTTSYYGYPDGKKGFFECKPYGDRCSYVQRCCGSLKCHRDKFFHFFGLCS